MNAIRCQQAAADPGPVPPDQAPQETAHPEPAPPETKLSRPVADPVEPPAKHTTPVPPPPRPEATRAFFRSTEQVHTNHHAALAAMEAAKRFGTRAPGAGSLPPGAQAASRE